LQIYPNYEILSAHLPAEGPVQAGLYPDLISLSVYLSIRPVHHLPEELLMLFIRFSTEQLVGLVFGIVYTRTNSYCTIMQSDCKIVQLSLPLSNDKTPA
jgi:hypothetical protein